MYTLRIITTEKRGKGIYTETTKNICIGDEYSTMNIDEGNLSSIFYKINSPSLLTSPQELEDLEKKFSDCNARKILFYDVDKYLILNWDNENITYQYFIMTESGKTFERI